MMLWHGRGAAVLFVLGPAQIVFKDGGKDWPL